MNTVHYEKNLDPVKILQAARSSVKRKAFSRKQSVRQKWFSLLGSVLCFSALFGIIGYAALIPGAIAFLLIRWKNLGVLHFKENLMFSAVWLYTSLLAALAITYDALYEKVFRHVTMVQFFPKFPYNQQVLTESTTQGELTKRDSFWKERLPTKVPSPNLLTIVRIAGAISLVFLRDLQLRYFLPFVGFLFLTDYFDGIIARTRNRETTFGKWADPIGDALLLVSIGNYLYRLYPGFGATFFLMLIPQVCIVVFFGITFLTSGMMDHPRPVIWGRLKFTLYALGTLSMLLGNMSAARLCFSLGIVFGCMALTSYITRKYQEAKKESVFLVYFVGASVLREFGMN